MTDIKTLNDNFRKTFSGGRVTLSCGTKQTIHTMSMILEVFTIKASKYIGKLIIMIKIIGIAQKIQVIQI